MSEGVELNTPAEMRLLDAKVQGYRSGLDRLFR